MSATIAPLNEDAFDGAVLRFGEIYAIAYEQSCHSADGDEAHHEALTEALQAFLRSYLENTR